MMRWIPSIGGDEELLKPILEVKNLNTYFYTDDAVVKAVDDVSFSIPRGQTVCIVGESGCGKSVASLSIMGLVSKPGKIIGGEILFEERDLLKLGSNEMRSLRGNDIAMIFQEPMTALNPVFTIGQQMSEVLMEHQLLDKKAAYYQSEQLIEKVGIPEADRIIGYYPHQLSGGMLQRIMIAIALSCHPKLLIADEPTTALDVTIQAQILDLLHQLKSKLGMSVLFITHDLGVVAEIADYVVVMYAGKIIEAATVLELFQNPQHPYMQGLLKCKPRIGQHKNRLYTIRGQVPELVNLGNCCYFNGRCDFCQEICKHHMPLLAADGNGHKVACWLYEKGRFDG